MKAISRLSRHSSRTSRHSVDAGPRPAEVDPSTSAELIPSDTPPVNLSPWRREPLPPARTGAGRALAWASARRTPLVAGALSIALMGALVGGAFRMPVSAEASQAGTTFEQVVPGSATGPGSTGTSDSVTRFAVVAGVSPLARTGGWMSTVGTSVTLSTGGWIPVGVGAPDGGPLVLGGGPSAPAAGAGSVAGSTGGSQPSGAAGAAGSSGGAAGAGTAYPVVTRPGGAPAAPTAPSAPAAPPSGPAPVVAAPSAPLTAAQQTAANASAAAALTAANAKADADLTAANALAAANLTAANAKAAADLTAANAAAAAAATAEAAAAAAWATAHPLG